MCTFAPSPHIDLLKFSHQRATTGRKGNATGRDEARAVHRRHQHSCRRKGVGFRYRLQTLANGIPEPWHFGARVLLHRSDRVSGILPGPTSARLARLQWLHCGYKTSQRVRRWRGTSQVQAQHGHRTRGGCDGPCPTARRDSAVFWRRRLSRACASTEVPGRPRYRRVHNGKSATDHRRRTPSTSRRLYRLDGVAAEDPPRRAGADPTLSFVRTNWAFALRLVSSKSILLLPHEKHGPGPAGQDPEDLRWFCDC